MLKKKKKKNRCCACEFPRKTRYERREKRELLLLEDKERRGRGHTSAMVHRETPPAGRSRLPISNKPAYLNVKPQGALIIIARRETKVLLPDVRHKTNRGPCGAPRRLRRVSLHPNSSQLEDDDGHHKHRVNNAGNGTIKGRHSLCRRTQLLGLRCSRKSICKVRYSSDLLA